MKVLIVGNGGREHALGWGITQSAKEVELFFAPGNPGTAELGTNVSIPVTELDDLVLYAKESSIDLAIIGPELPLSMGVVDRFESASISCFGPNQAAAEIEASKNFAKEIMQAAGVPTAHYRYCTSESDALAAIEDFTGPYVIKADGLAAGKGVVVTPNLDEAKEAIRNNFKGAEGAAVVLEEFLEGKEASFIVMTDGERVVPLPTAHDYKRIGDGDQGPNTGGMGTVSPTPNLPSGSEQIVLETVIQPTINELKKRGIPYKGFLYAGLMISPAGDISVVEFNARMGDPEAQVLMRRFQGDLFGTLAALSNGSELPPQEEPSQESAVCLVMASDGYPVTSRKGDVISGLDKANALDDCVVFHAGTKSENDEIITYGGRVLGVTATGETQHEARLKAYQAVDQIQFDGAQFRKDIAA